MESLNFTQFCVKQGYASNYDILNHSLISPNGKISKRAKDLELKAMSGRIEENVQAHAEYEALVLSGAIVDPSGDYTRMAIVRALNGKVQAEIDGINNSIKYINGLGKMSHTKAGRLKKGYQRTITEYESRIKALKLKFIPELLADSSTS